MKRPSLKELADSDPQIAQFLERSERKVNQRIANTEATSANKKYGSNHLPETRDLGSDAANAISRCILP